MKIFCLVMLLVCASAHAADFNNEVLPQADSVETQLQNTHLELNLLSKDSEVSEDDLLLASELETIQEQMGRNIVTDAIENMLEDIRGVIINGNDDVPPLDPLEIPIIGPIDYSNSGIFGTLTINDVNMQGLRWFVVDNISFNTIRLAFRIQVTVPRLTITGSYDARSRIGLLTHSAGGNFRIFAHRIEVGLDMRLGTNILAGHLVLRELNIKIDIHDTHVQIHGVTGSPLINAFINNLVQNVSQELIQSEMENVSKLISEQLFDVINDVLKDYTINDILGM